MKTEDLLREKCQAAEAARDSYAGQLEEAKERISSLCDSFEKSSVAFKQLQDQVDMSHKIQKKMQQESDLLKRRSDLVQQKSERLMAENTKLLEQVSDAAEEDAVECVVVRWTECVARSSIPSH